MPAKNGEDEMQNIDKDTQDDIAGREREGCARLVDAMIEVFETNICQAREGGQLGAAVELEHQCEMLKNLSRLIRSRVTDYAPPEVVQ